MTPLRSTNAVNVLLVSIIPCPSGSSISGWPFASRATAPAMSGLEKSVPVSTTATTIPSPVAPYSVRAPSAPVAASWWAASAGSESWWDESIMSRIPYGWKAPSTTTMRPSTMYRCRSYGRSASGCSDIMDESSRISDTSGACGPNTSYSTSGPSAWEAGAARAKAAARASAATHANIAPRMPYGRTPRYYLLRGEAPPKT